MVSPSKRASRNRRASVRDATVDRTDEPSPSRPAKRRKQAEGSPQEIPEEEGSSLVADSSNIDFRDASDVITRVAQHLVCPANQLVQVRKEHSNSNHHELHSQVTAFAKIAGPDWTFYVTKTTINVGRRSDPAPPHPALDESEVVHIDLGPSKTISRQHAVITFDGDWTLKVKGRNAVKVDGEAVKCGLSVVLTSGRVIEISGIEMIFVLPLENTPLRIHPIFLERADIQGSEFAATGEELELVGAEDAGDGPATAVRPSSSGQLPQTTPSGRVKLPRGPTGTQAIAPAPPDYRRPGTPPSVRNRATAVGLNTSPNFKDAGTMLLNPNEVDLSLDENHHIKPQYSYAQMITQAILNTPDDKLNLAGIYNFITTKYSYYRHQLAGGWQNSIRHNLSLNKSFEKVARSTDEPGKGMKWQIVPEARDEMIAAAYKGGRGGHRGSSNPSSPNQLNYVNQGLKEMAARGDQGSARKRKVSPSGSPQPRSAPRDAQLMTPDRSSRRLLPGEPLGGGIAADGSPLPRLRKPLASGAGASALATSISLPPPLTSDGPTAPPRSPTLTSSYLQDEGGSFVTPAPHRINVRIAPPSTAQRPSQHMPTSSPAPFWKFADIGSTPAKPPQFDLSPSRRLDPLPQSSSPPPARAASKSPVPSPGRRPSSRPAEDSDIQPAPDDDSENNGGDFDLTKGFQPIGSFHARFGRGFTTPATNGKKIGRP